MMPHWLFINGVQPAIPENALLEGPVTKRHRVAVPKADTGAAGKPAKQEGTANRGAQWAVITTRLSARHGGPPPGPYLDVGNASSP